VILKSIPGSTYTCIAIAFERYLGIVHTHAEGLGRRARYYIITILFVSAAIDIPRCATGGNSGLPDFSWYNIGTKNGEKYTK
jgi:hypothetical protein